MPQQLLLADDSVTIQRVIRLTFASEDLQVVTVGDGDQAVAAIERQPPDIVLADVAMPGRTGYDVAEHIRKSPKLAHIPVLLLTAAFEPVDEARVRALRCDGVVAKPFEPELVVARVKELLANPRPVSPSSGSASASASASAAAPASASPTPSAGPDLPRVTPPAPRPEVDAYFERLDQAFAALAASPRPAVPVDDPVSRPAGEVLDVPATASEPPATPGGEVEGLPLTERQIELIADRVLARLAGRLGVPLADVVAAVAERVVREEIADIKRRI